MSRVPLNAEEVAAGISWFLIDQLRTRGFVEDELHERLAKAILIDEQNKDYYYRIMELMFSFAVLINNIFARTIKLGNEKEHAERNNMLFGAAFHVSHELSKMPIVVKHKQLLKIFDSYITADWQREFEMIFECMSTKQLEIGILKIPLGKSNLNDLKSFVQRQKLRRFAILFEPAANSCVKFIQSTRRDAVKPNTIDAPFDFSGMADSQFEKLMEVHWKGLTGLENYPERFRAPPNVNGLRVHAPDRSGTLATCVDINHESSLIATGYANGLLIVCPMQGKPLLVKKASEETLYQPVRMRQHTFRAHAGTVTGCAFLAKNGCQSKLLSCSIDGTVRLFCLLEWKCTHVFGTAFSPAEEIRCAPSGAYFASRTSNGNTLLFDCESMELQRVYNEPNKKASCFEFHPTDDYLLVGYNNGALLLYTSWKSEPIREYLGVPYPVLKVCFNNKGNFLICSFESGHVAIWELYSCNVRARFTMPSDVVALSYLADGMLALCTGTFLKVFDLSLRPRWWQTGANGRGEFPLSEVLSQCKAYKFHICCQLQPFNIHMSKKRQIFLTCTHHMEHMELEQFLNTNNVIFSLMQAVE